MPTDAPADERLLSLEEFALAIGKSVRTVSRYVRQGRIQTMSVPELGRSVLRVPESEIFKMASPHDGQPPPDGRHAERPMTDSDEHDLSDVRHVTAMNQGVVSDVRHVSDLMSDVRHAPLGFISAPDILARYETVTVRLGWLEGQLDVSRRMLSDGGQRESELLAKADAEREARIKAELGGAEVQRRADEAEKRAQEMAAELAVARARIEQIELEQQRPWWKKLFSGGS